MMVSGPFLFPFHSAPIASFWAEWWAGALGLTAAAFGLVTARDRLLLPPLLLVPALLLALLLVQLAIGRLAFLQIALLYAAYLIWAGLMLVLGRALADTIGLARLAEVIAIALILGTLIGAAIAVVQWLGIADRVLLVLSDQRHSVFGNLGQRNHHAHFSWIGIASAFYLRGRNRVSRGLFWFLVLSIGFGSLLGGSRSVFVYLLIIIASLAWTRHRDPHGQAATLFVDGVVLLPIFMALNFFGAWVSPQLPEFWRWFGTNFPSLDLTGVTPGADSLSGARIYAEVSGRSIRLDVLRTAWAAFVDRPWLGQGAGNYSWASFMAAVARTDDEQYIVTEHAHNFVLQLLAEFGAPAVLAVILLLAFWAKQFFSRPWKLEHWWCAAILGIGAVHSTLEYPLWYSFFLGPTALLLGATGSQNAIAVAGQRAAIYLVLAALAGALILSNLRTDYSEIEAATNSPLAAHPDRDHAWRISMDRLLKLHHESLLSPWVLLAFTNLAEPDRQLAHDQAVLCERGIKFVPARFLVTRCAMQLAIAGRHAEAQKLAIAVLRAFPAERAATSDELAKGAQKFPELVPLWHLSVSK